MKIYVKQIHNNQEWEYFYLKQTPSIFVQSKEYGEFMERLGNKSFILGIYEEDVLVGGALVSHVRAKRGDFLYIPYGPILTKEAHFKEFIYELKKIAKLERVTSIKISPFIDNTEENKYLYKKYGFRDSPLHILAETTWVLDITKPEDELLSSMRKNHRYLIRRAEKDGVMIRQSDKIEDIDIFIRLHLETVKRHKFVPFSEKYIKEEFKVFNTNNQSKIFLAEYDKKIISASIIIFYGDTAVYRHGASSSEHKKIPSSYLMLYEAICEAKKRGMKYFNFWGIAPDKNKKHPFAGITLFKTGFGGERKDLLHCQDLPVSLRYWFAWGVDTYRKIRRGF